MIDRKDMDPRWQAFVDSWIIRMMAIPWTDKLAALVTRGLSDEAPMSHRWRRVGLLLVATLLLCGAGLAFELMLVRLVTSGK